MSCFYNCPRGPAAENGPASIPPLGRTDMKRLSLLSLYVNDPDATIDFYTRKLGFDLVEDVPFGSQRWITLRLPDDDLTCLTLHLATTDEDRALVGKQGGRHPLFAMVTDDCVG